MERLARKPICFGYHISTSHGTSIFSALIESEQWSPEYIATDLAPFTLSPTKNIGVLQNVQLPPNSGINVYPNLYSIVRSFEGREHYVMPLLVFNGFSTIVGEFQHSDFNTFATSTVVDFCSPGFNSAFRPGSCNFLVENNLSKWDFLAELS
jgi:hypothetical protein